MTDQKPNPCNCSTCTKCPFLFGTFFEDRLNHPIYEIVQHTGCLSHTDAGEYLMREILQKERDNIFAEVKRQLDNCILSCDNPDKEDAFDYAIDVVDEVCSKRVNDYGRMGAFAEAIALIKDGVEK